MLNLRQPIVTVCGHVDHGKTSILDSLRSTSVQKGEAGGITQKISFTLMPSDELKKSCPLIEKSGIKLDIPGFLFIDTPGHAAFTNLRKRGGSLADLAVLVIDINEGIKPQTAEVIQILKHNKTPFLIALNKIDNISGWQIQKDKGIKESIESQAQNVRRPFDERLFTLEGALHSHGFESDLFYNMSDFTKKIAIVPVSARTKEGLQELTMVLCGISQKYLGDRLKLNKEAKGIILEVKKEKTINYAEAILYDGVLKNSDTIAIANFPGTDSSSVIISKIRILEEVLPLSSKFKAKKEVTASTGLRLQLVEKENVLPGMPFVIFKNNKNDLEKEFKKEISEAVKTSKSGIIAKADSLGSLEALLVMLEQSHVPVVKVGIGNINKTDIISAKANLDINEIDAIVVGFNVDIDEDARELAKGIKGIHFLTDEVVYKLIENLGDWRKKKASEIEKRRLMELAAICKLTILHKYVFRNSNPAIFGVKVEAGKLKQNLQLIDNKGEKVSRVKNIQSDNKSVDSASEGMEIAISLPGTNFERRLGDVETLYSDLSESQFKKFKKNKDLLTQSEIKTLQEIAEVKRRGKGGCGEAI